MPQKEQPPINNNECDEFHELLNKNLIKQYCNDHALFQEIESKSSCTRIAPVGKYIVIRIDGVGLRTRYLNDSIKNPQFNKIMDYAIRETYFITHRKSPTNAQQIYIGATSTSDEAIFIFNTENNYFQRQILHMASLIVSTFTAYFIKMADRIAKSTETKPMFGVFTAKSYVLNSLDDVINYVNYRASFAARHQLTKELRLNGLNEESLRFKTHLYDLDYYFEKLDEYNVSLSSINKHFSIYFIDSQFHQKLKVYRTPCLHQATRTMYRRFRMTEHNTLELNNADKKKCNNPK